MQKTYLLVRLVILLFTANISFAQSNLTEKLPIAPEIRVGKLSNGLTYYIRKNARPEKKVELRLAIKAGSILEDDDQQGLAHFTEHMAFNGSQHFKKNDLVSFLQSIGVKFGADLNAYTGFDETVYILPIPVDKPENLDQGFLVLEDWASTVAFEPIEIDKERGVVLEEDRLGKGAQERMSKKMLPLILQGSKYALRLPIGKSEILKTFKPETIKRFYKDWYRPDLMAVFVVGDVDPATAEALIKKHFEKRISNVVALFQKQLDALDAYMASPVYPEVQKALEIELEGLETSILSMSPNNTEAVAMLNLWHGQRTSVIRQISYFEGLRDLLKSQLSKMDEEGQIVAEKLNTENINENE